MISLDQIQKLETRVSRAVELIKTLKAENTSLTSRLEEYRGRIEEMEAVIGRFKEDQNAIERGVLSALEQLDLLEDGLSQEDNEQEAERPASMAEPTPVESSPAAVGTDETSEENPADDDSELDIF